MSEVGLFWLLLPAAALSTWYIARRGSEKSSGRRVSELSTTYFRGLNFLLNEQPDKAIEVFLEIAEVDSDTVETHLALGNLFRRRGEVDRAIRLHQNLIARPALSAEHRATALLELGEDYMRAGLLDRAETLFLDLVDVPACAPQALRQLITIYQQERDWPKAIEHARRLEAVSGEPMGALVAQFHCECVEQALARGDHERARTHLRRAFTAQPDCTRGLLLQARLLCAQGRDVEAVDALEQALDLDIDLAPEVLGPILECYRRAGLQQRARRFLGEVVERDRGISPMLALAALIREMDGVSAAVDYLDTQLRRRPSVRGLEALIELSLLRAQGGARENLLVLKELVRRLLEGQAIYRCNRCGFGARSHHWQCPSCKSWNSVRPVHGVAGE